MPRSRDRAYSRYSLEAAALLGRLIQLGRRERRQPPCRLKTRHAAFRFEAKHFVVFSAVCAAVRGKPIPHCIVGTVLMPGVDCNIEPPENVARLSTERQVDCRPGGRVGHALYCWPRWTRGAVRY